MDANNQLSLTQHARSPPHCALCCSICSALTQQLNVTDPGCGGMDFYGHALLTPNKDDCASGVNTIFK